jgi:hypothetical protein
MVPRLFAHGLLLIAHGAMHRRAVWMASPGVIPGMVILGNGCQLSLGDNPSRAGILATKHRGRSVSRKHSATTRSRWWKVLRIFSPRSHFAIAESRETAVAPVAMLGASNRIPAEVLELFTRKRVRIFPHTDAAGLRAAATWETQLRPFVDGIDAFDFSGLTMTCKKPIKDLNDLTSIDPDCFEREPALQSMTSF